MGTTGQVIARRRACDVAPTGSGHLPKRCVERILPARKRRIVTLCNKYSEDLGTCFAAVVAACRSDVLTLLFLRSGPGSSSVRRCPCRVRSEWRDQSQEPRWTLRTPRWVQQLVDVSSGHPAKNGQWRRQNGDRLANFLATSGATTLGFPHCLPWGFKALIPF